MNRIKPKQFAEMINLINAGKISSRGAKDIMAQLIANNMEENHEIEKFAERNGLIQKSDAGSLAPIIDKVIADNAKAVGEYKAGKLASLQFLIGMAMKASKGAGNPEVVKKMLEERLN